MSAPHPNAPARPSARVRRRRRFALLLTVAIVVISALVVAIVLLLTPTPRPAPSEAPTASETPASTPTPTPTPTPTFDATAFSLTDPTSPWVIVNKLNPLQPVDYAPELRVVNVPYVYEPRMRPEAADAIERMFAAFTAETGLEMQSQSAYRSYQTQ